jgi:hypothetical protein
MWIMMGTGIIYTRGVNIGAEEGREIALLY